MVDKPIRPVHVQGRAATSATSTSSELSISTQPAHPSGRPLCQETRPVTMALVAALADRSFGKYKAKGSSARTSPLRPRPSLPAPFDARMTSGRDRRALYQHATQGHREQAVTILCRRACVLAASITSVQTAAAARMKSAARRSSGSCDQGVVRSRKRSLRRDRRSAAG